LNISELFEQINLDMIKQFIIDGQEEHLNLDFKLLNKSDLSNKDDKRNYARVISGFANSNGGITVWGVDCRKNEEGIDCASKIHEIDNIDLLHTRMIEFTGVATNPIVDGVTHKKIYTVAPKGMIVTLVPESEAGPHMAKLSEARYFKRSGGSFYKMEHFDIADMFAKRRRPLLSLDYIAKAKHRITIRIRNDGRGTAIAPYLWVKCPPEHGINLYGVDGNGNWNIPMLSSSHIRDFGGNAQHAIHPNTAIEIFVFQRNDNRAVVGPINIQYGLAADGTPLREGNLTINIQE